LHHKFKFPSRFINFISNEIEFSDTFFVKFFVLLGLLASLSFDLPRPGTERWQRMSLHELEDVGVAAAELLDAVLLGDFDRFLLDFPQLRGTSVAENETLELFLKLRPMRVRFSVGFLLRVHRQQHLLLPPEASDRRFVDAKMPRCRSVVVLLRELDDVELLLNGVGLPVRWRRLRLWHFQFDFLLGLKLQVVKVLVRLLKLILLVFLFRKLFALLLLDVVCILLNHKNHFLVALRLGFLEFFLNFFLLEAPRVLIRPETGENFDALLPEHVGGFEFVVAVIAEEGVFEDLKGKSVEGKRKQSEVSRISSRLPAVQ
jgi:hypothetical protein